MVTIADLDRDGRGRAVQAGRTVLVAQAYPGETVRFRVDRASAGALQGRVVAVLQPARERTERVCRHEGHCTGCPLVSWSPAAEAAWKHARVERAVAGARAPGAVVAPLVTPAGPFGYRHLAKQEVVWRDGRVELGAFVHGTHLVTSTAGCPVLRPELAAVLDRLAALATLRRDLVHVAGPVPADAAKRHVGLRHVVARLSRATGEILLTLVTSEPGGAGAAALGTAFAAAEPMVASVWVVERTDAGNAVLNGVARHIAGAQVIHEELAGFRYALGPQAFFQINPVAAEVLFAAVVELAGTGASLVEFHAGSGALTLPLSLRFDRVVAVESAPSAVDLARANAAAHSRTNITCVAGDADAVAGDVLAAARPAVIVLDPPRRGAGPELIAAATGSGARAVVLLSCDPEALGRDAAAFVEHGWVADRVVSVDQFPRTAHVEAATRFVSGARRPEIP